MNMMGFREQRMRMLADGGDVRKQFRAQTSDGVTELYFYDAIDSWGGYWGISAKDVIESLMGAQDVLIHLNSPGGEAIEALAIYSTLRQHAGNVTVRIEGMAASAASVVMLGGNRVIIDPNALVMIHDAWGYSVGNAMEMHSYADTLDLVSQNMAHLYAAKSGGDPEDFRSVMRSGQKWYAGQAAVDAGLADEVGEFAETSGDGELIGDEDDEELFAFARWDRGTVAALYNQASPVVLRSRPGDKAPAAGAPPAPVAGAATHDSFELPDWEEFRAALGGLKTT